jgi:protein TonB
MFELNKLVPKNQRLLPAAPSARNSEERKQRRMMVIALTLLLTALGFVLYRDRDFWFPDTEQAEEQPQPATPSVATTTAALPDTAATGDKKARIPKKRRNGATAGRSAAVTSSAQPDSPAPPDASGVPPLTATTTRTVLPPLEVEVVAGDVHKTVHPGTNSVRVDLQPGAPLQEVAVPAGASRTSDSAAGVTSNAAERVQMSAGTAEVVSRPVRPDYPLLARQMKVQGSVILQALIGRDGLIQDLHVLSGPPILASAAQEAVKQWHFKPHYQGVETVETQARITVNFTISTN